MPTDPTVIAVLAAAAEKDPENIALRLHLISLLIEADQMSQALKHCGDVLNTQPDNVEALRFAARAAEATGETRRAEAYRRLLAALDPPLPQPPDIPRSSLDEADWPTDLSFIAEEKTPAPLPAGVASPLDSLELTWQDEEKQEFWEAEQPDVTLADVAGMEEVKRRLNLAFLGPLKNPEMMKMYGKSLRGGLLLYGPPGCGKTFIARATAGELGAKFISVGLADVLDMWLGQSEKNLHEIFQSARRNAPCVIFFDEIDALGQKRSLQRHSGGRTVINQLLAEMDSVNADNKGIFVLAATNHPWDVDTALRRPGRLDRTLLVLPPDAKAREAILQLQSRNRPVDKLDYNWIAGKSAEFSGADLVHLCESAAEIAMEESLTGGRVRPIGMSDFKKALKEIKPSTRAWFEVARNYAMFSNDGGEYDALLEHLRANRLL